MMTDRELLELAAKAIGLAYEWNACASCGIQYIPKGLSQYVDWSPLDDDGDALRLAVRLGITIGPESPDVIGPSLCRVSWENKTRSLGEYGGGNAEIATRRAIVRAAAAIGKDMP